MPTFGSQQPAYPAIAEPWAFANHLQHPFHQRRLVGARLLPITLTRTRLIQRLTRPSLGDGELTLQFADRRTLPGRAYQFPSLMCFSIWMSRAWSATNRFNRRFSSSSSFSRLAS